MILWRVVLPDFMLGIFFACWGLTPTPLLRNMFVWFLVFDKMSIRFKYCIGKKFGAFQNGAAVVLRKKWQSIRPIKFPPDASVGEIR